MRKITAFFMVFLLVFVFCGPVFAGDISKNAAPAPLFEITGGLGPKNPETTFDASRTVTGSAPRGSEVSIAVSKPNPEFDNTAPIGEYNAPYVLIKEYSLTVGSLGFFAVDIELSTGENYIVVSAANPLWEKETRLDYKIKRKDLEIKLKLEASGIILPGEALRNGGYNEF